VFALESPSRSTPLILAAEIRKRFGGKVVLDGVGLEVGPGEVLALVGENGAGKTTLLRICAGLLSADAGRVQVGARIGYCPQAPGLFELLTAEEQLVLFGRALGLSRTRSRAEGRAILEEFGFPLNDAAVARDLSGGTRQKLNLALALLGDPGVLLLDEPYQGFDRGAYVNFWEHVDDWRRRGKATVVVTHMLAELARVDRVLELAVSPPAAALGDSNGGSR